MSSMFQLPSRTDSLAHLVDFDLWIKRDDRIHPIVSGNKWRKLKGFFEELPEGSTVLTFGGAYSNHLPATAKACAVYGVRVIGVVRGEELDVQSNANLRYCASEGMELQFVSREEYRSLREGNWLPTIEQRRLWNAESSVVLPEGGAGEHVAKGCGEIWSEIPMNEKPDHLVVASGTGATVIGILKAMPAGSSTVIHVVSAVKGAHLEARAVQELAASKGIKLHWEDEVHYGGFGKVNDALMEAKSQFEAASGIALDRNYNSKVWAYLNRRTWSGRVLWLHTGGIGQFE